MEDVLSELKHAMALLESEGNALSARMLSLWNSDAKRYEPADEANLIHDLINNRLLIWFRIRDAIRLIEGRQL